MQYSGIKRFFLKNIGIVIGAVYAIILRLLFDNPFLDDMFSLFSITFVWVVPFVIGSIPLFLATKEQLRSWNFRMTSPVLTVIVFCTICFITRLEDLICLWILIIPYAAAALVCGVLIGGIIMLIKQRKETLFSLMLLPFVLSIFEQQFESPTRSYNVSTKVVINATPETIWQHIIRVRPIENHEFKKGFFNYAGIPRPLYAELTKDTLGAIRKGHFEGGLTFVETVTSWKMHKQIGFDIKVIPSSIRQTVFDQHILKGDHFRFLNACYILKPINEKQTELILSSSYQLETKFNGYASFWGDLLLMDFQERLLQVIKKRCDD